MTANRKPRDESVRPDTARRILQVAEALFAEHGFDGVSMNAIAERAGVSKASVFHHFNSKNALYLAVLKDCTRQAASLLESMGQDDAPVAERLRAFSRAHLAHILERKQASRIMQHEMLKGGPRRGQELAQQVFGESFARFVEMLRQGQERGELRQDIDPAMVAIVIISADVFYFQTQHVLRHFPAVTFGHEPGEYSAKVMDLLLHGVLHAPKNA